MLKRLRSWFRVLTSRRDFEDGMSEELGFHIEQYTEDLLRSGVPAREAMRRARLEFGNVVNVKDDCRRATGVQLFDEFLREFRHAFRLLRKTPGFTATALVTLAVCIGANLTIFAVVDAILLRPLPFPEPNRLVTAYNTYPKAGVDRDGSSLTNYYERRGQIPALASLAIYRLGISIVGETGATKREQIAQVSPEFFSTLGIAPALGRSFTEGETTYQTDRVVILSDSYWRQHFNSDPNVIGRRIRGDGVPYTVVGVLPPSFRFLSSEARLYFPRASSPQERGPSQRHSGGNSTHMIARLAPGATVAQAQSQIDAQNARLASDDSQAKMMADAGFRTVVTSLHADHVASIRPTLLLLQAGALALLLIGTVNLANLLLVRASSRGKEHAVRQALGASRMRLIVAAVVETTLVTTIGALLGLGAGYAGIQLVAALGADRLPLGAQVAFDQRLAAAALACAVVLGFALAVPVAWFNCRGELANAIQSETRGGTSNRAAQRLRHSFIVAQIALALVLLDGAGLLALSLKHAMAVSPGFRSAQVITGQVRIPWTNYPRMESRIAFNEKLIKAMNQQPGVSASGLADNIPFSGRSGKSAATVKGRSPRPGEAPRGHYSYGVDGDYFRAMGLTLREGRFLTAEDSRRKELLCVVDEDFARYYWPNSSALGQQLFQGGQARPDREAFTIVGVVGAAKQSGLTADAAQGAVYYPYAMRADDSVYLAVRTSLPIASFGRTLERAVRQIDPELTVNDVRTMDGRIGDSLIARRSPALLAGIFSLIAVLLTAVGAYGVLSYAVAQRRREIGVRMALGAQQQQIRGQFLSMGLRLLGTGVLLGIAGAWLVGAAMRTLLFDVAAFDLTTIFSAVGVLAVVSVAACLLPAFRAARISPVEALAGE